MLANHISPIRTKNITPPGTTIPIYLHINTINLVFLILIPIFAWGRWGFLNIEALGEKTGFGQDAQSLLQVCTRLCDIYQQTSQADFEKSRKSATAAVPPGHAITGPNGPNLVTPGNENNCNDKLGEILQNAKDSLWENRQHPLRFCWRS